MPKRKRSPKPASESWSNLNERMPRRQPAKVAVESATLLFNPHILPCVRQKIMRAHYVVLSVAWLSNRPILEALRSTKGCSVIVTHDNAQLRKFREPLGLLPKMEGARSAVFTVNSGRSRALMHHKYMVLLDERKQPTGEVGDRFVELHRAVAEEFGARARAAQPGPRAAATRRPQGNAAVRGQTSPTLHQEEREIKNSTIK